MLSELADKKALLGGLLATASGGFFKNESGPTIHQINSLKIIENELYTLESRSKSLLTDRSITLADIERLIDGCGDRIEEINTAGVNQILSIGSKIERSNKEMTKNIEIYKKVLNKKGKDD